MSFFHQWSDPYYDISFQQMIRIWFCTLLILVPVKIFQSESWYPKFSPPRKGHMYDLNLCMAYHSQDLPNANIQLPSSLLTIYFPKSTQQKSLWQISIPFSILYLETHFLVSDTFQRNVFVFSFLEHSTSGPPITSLVSLHPWGSLSPEDPTGSWIQTLSIRSIMPMSLSRGFQTLACIRNTQSLIKTKISTPTPRIFDLVHLGKGSGIISEHQGMVIMLKKYPYEYTYLGLFTDYSPMRRLNNEGRDQE